MQYYGSKHMPMVQQKCAPECGSIVAEGGLAGGAPGSAAPFIAVGHLTFDSLAAFTKVVRAARDENSRRYPHYTNTKPVIQIGEITL